MEVPSFPAVVTVACVLLTAFLLYGRLRRRLPPGPSRWPFVGNAHTVTPVRFRCFAEWAKRYGPVMSVWLGPKLNVVVSTPELAREMLKEKDQQLADRPRNRVNAEFSRGGQDLIWADYGPHYVKVRKVCTLHLFSPRSLEALRPIREDEVTAVVETIYRDCVDPEKGVKSLAVRNYLVAVAFNNITRLVLGKRFMSADGVVDAQGRELKAITAKEGKLRVSPSIADYVPCLRWLFPVDEAAFAENAARRDRLTKTLMAEHAGRLRQQNGGHPKGHLVDALLTLQKEYDLTDDTISGLLWDMITAGIDTATISVEWAMAELIRNPRVQAKAQEELDRVVGPDRIMTEADFPNLPYLQWVTKEALRLHPPTPLMLPHKANTDVKLGGYDVPKGSTVLVNVWAIARDPAVWKDPLEFQPERFEEEDMDMKGHDFRLLPFGAGRRVCPGAQLGIYMVQSILGHLLHQFRWELPQGVRPEDMDMSEKPGLVTYMHSPLQAVATPRLEATHLYKRVLFEMC